MSPDPENNAKAVSSHRHRSYLLPGLSHDVETAQQAERMQLRREELEKAIKTESFYDWQATQKEKYPDSLLTTDPVWWV